MILFSIDILLNIADLICALACPCLSVLLLNLTIPGLVLFDFGRRDLSKRTHHIEHQFVDGNVPRDAIWVLLYRFCSHSCQCSKSPSISQMI